MSISSLRRQATRRLPAELQVSFRRLAGRSRPWDSGASLSPPRRRPGTEVGPPDFIGVGVQKAGTSWWFAMILAHPGVWHPEGVHKERHFFTEYWRKPFTEEDVSKYHEWFPRLPGSITGEWTPAYMAQFWVPPLLAAAAPEAKVLVLLRDPVDRFQSGLTHHLSRQQTDARVAGDAFMRGYYADQLSWLGRQYAAEQMLVLQYELCRRDPSSQLAKTYEFLQLDPAPVVARSFQQRVNATTQRKVTFTEETRRMIVELYSDQVRLLAEQMPALDLTLWPNFAHLA